MRRLLDVALLAGVLAVALAYGTAQDRHSAARRAVPAPTPTLLPDEEWDASWHQVPQPYDGWVIGFNDEGETIVVRECRYVDGSTSGTLECTDWIELRQEHWRWLKREVDRTVKWR